MRKKVSGIICFMTVLLLLAGCGHKTEKEEAPEAFSGMAVRDWTELDCGADREDSIRNSNMLNLGYLTFDEEGHIFFSDLNGTGIYMSGPKGENRQQLCETTGSLLQVAADWLYFSDESEIGIKRISVKTGETENVREEACGEYLLVDDKLYINGQEGFSCAGLDGTEPVVLRSNEPEMVSYTTDGTFWMGNAINGTDVSWFWRGYLLGYDMFLNQLYYIGEGATYPLIVGNWISVFDVVTATRHVWKIDTKEDVDLKVYAQKAVGDGEKLYYAKKESQGCVICSWDGKSESELLQTGADEVSYLYLSEEMLYWIQGAGSDTGKTWECRFYDMQTGESGEIY